MPKHRTLNLRKLVSAVPWDLFQEYFAKLQVDPRPSAWAYINPDAMFDFLEDPQNAQASAIILEDFKRINNICTNSMDLVIRAYRTYHIPFNDRSPTWGWPCACSSTTGRPSTMPGAVTCSTTPAPR